MAKKKDPLETDIKRLKEKVGAWKAKTENAEGEYRFGKLGRLTKEELEGVLPLLKEAAALL